jgi:hypothetical protein
MILLLWIASIPRRCCRGRFGMTRELRGVSLGRVAHIIAVRQRDLSDEELLTRLGLVGIVRRDDYVQGDWDHHLDMGCVFVGNDSEWTHIHDNEGYTLENWAGLRARIVRLAVDFDVFECLVGDPDDYYYFELHRHGELVRKRVVDPYTSTGGVVTVDVGEPLLIESEPDFGAGLDQLWRVARSLGIDTDFEIPLRGHSFRTPDEV